MPSQDLQIIFEMQSQKNSQKKAVKKKCFFELQSTFFSFWTLLLSNLITFLFSFHLKRFKALKKHILNFYKSSWNSNSNRAATKNKNRCSKTDLCNVHDFIFSVLDPLYFKGYNFLNFIPFLTIFSAPNVPIREVQVLFGHQEQQSPPPESCALTLKC